MSQATPFDSTYRKFEFYWRLVSMAFKNSSPVLSIRFSESLGYAG